MTQKWGWLCQAVWLALLLPIFNSCPPPGLLTGMCRKCKKAKRNASPSPAAGLTQPNHACCQHRSSGKGLSMPEDVWEKKHQWPWAQRQGRTQTTLRNLKQPHSAARPHQSSSGLFIYLGCRECWTLRVLPSLPGQWELLLWAVLSRCSSWWQHYWPHSQPAWRDRGFLSLLKSQLCHLFKWRNSWGMKGATSQKFWEKVSPQQHHLRSVLVVSKAT